MNLDLIHAIFVTFTIFYQDKWASKINPEKKINPETGEEQISDFDLTASIWFDELKNLNKSQIEKGLKKCREKFKSWPPTPMEFHELCLLSAEEMGAVSKVEAYLLAQQNNLENPFVYETVSKISNYRLLNEREQRLRFYEVYESIVERAKKTGIIPVRLEMKELPAPKRIKFTHMYEYIGAKSGEVFSLLKTLTSDLHPAQISLAVIEFEILVGFEFPFLTKFERLNFLSYVLKQESDKITLKMPPNLAVVR